MCQRPVSCVEPLGHSGEEACFGLSVLWPVFSRPGFGFEVFSLLYIQPPRPRSFTPTSRAVPGLTWDNSRGPTLPSLGTGTPQQKGSHRLGKGPGLAQLDARTCAHGCQPCSPLLHPCNLLSLYSARYFPAVIVKNIVTVVRNGSFFFWSVNIFI